MLYRWIDRHCDKFWTILGLICKVGKQYWANTVHCCWLARVGAFSPFPWTIPVKFLKPAQNIARRSCKTEFLPSIDIVAWRFQLWFYVFIYDWYLCKDINFSQGCCIFFRITRKRFFKLSCVSLYVKHISCAYLVTQLDPKKNPFVITKKSLATASITSILGWLAIDQVSYLPNPATEPIYVASNFLTKKQAFFSLFCPECMSLSTNFYNDLFSDF